MRAQALRVHSGVGREGLSRRGGIAEKSRQSRRDQTSLESPGSELCHVLAPLCFIDGFTLFDLTLSPSCFNLLLRITFSDKGGQNPSKTYPLGQYTDKAIAPFVSLCTDFSISMSWI